MEDLIQLLFATSSFDSIRFGIFKFKISLLWNRVNFPFSLKVKLKYHANSVRYNSIAFVQQRDDFNSG